ncbi:MAG: DUF4174 domain-containing protein [Silicimonas sp.]|nr:DUF4174 domain-containing protein [Silicimonas sp.]
MTRPIALISLVFLAAQPAFATDGTEAPASLIETWEAAPETVFEAEAVDLAALKWRARPVVVLADTPDDPAFRQQMELLRARADELIERDVLVITDTDPGAGSALRRKLRPRGFMLVLIGKDGGVKLRKPFPWDVRALSRQIDKMPMRQQEIRANQGR